MSTELLTLLAAGIFVVAILYSSVGHAGASGYIAVMLLLGLFRDGTFANTDRIAGLRAAYR